VAVAPSPASASRTTGMAGAPPSPAVELEDEENILNIFLQQIVCQHFCYKMLSKLFL
jgi:hypothetical protein